MKLGIGCLIHVIAVAGGLTMLGCSGQSTSIGDGTSGSAIGSPGAAHASNGEELFHPPAGQVSPDSIFGVWGGTKKDAGVIFDSRMKLTEDTATLATRCTLERSNKVSGIVGVTARARISEESLVVLESKSDEKNDGGVRCWVNVTPLELKRCAADATKGFEHKCFKVEGTLFTSFGESPLDTFEMTKLSD